MPRVQVRCYAELNEHLSKSLRQKEFSHEVSEGDTLRDALAALGVPLHEVNLLLVNGESVDSSYCLKEADRVSVYPVFDAIDVGPVSKIEKPPSRRMRFVLDVHLGKLAHHLRMLGFDALYRNTYTRSELLDAAAREDRILLSKGAALIEKSGVTAGYRIRSSDPREQLIEVLRRFDLWRVVRPFQRCLHCNAVLQRQEKSVVVDRLPEKVRGGYLNFNACPSCGRIYWNGTHYQKMKEFVERLFAQEGQGLPSNG